jgi:hypothetical protein
MLPSVMASDPAHDPNALPVEALKKPHVLSMGGLQAEGTSSRQLRHSEVPQSNRLELQAA